MATIRNESRSIVVIEGDLDDQMLIRSVFEDAGLAMPIRFIGNGREAMDYFFSQNRPVRLPCLGLLDLNLPEVSGQQVLERLRADPSTRQSRLWSLPASELPRRCMKFTMRVHVVLSLKPAVDRWKQN
jgi:CheY-like chemotaxis protein